MSTGHAIRAWPLTLWALGPGVLRVDYAGIPRALYARGEILLLGGAHEVKSPARLLTQTFAEWAAEADPDAAIDLRAAVVTRIAARALDHGHGGMILLVPAEVTVPLGVRVHYAVGEGKDVLAKRYDELTRGVAVEHRLERLRGARARAVDGHVYVRDEAQAAAIIVSQDGRLSLAIKDARGVVEVLGSFERGFGWR